MQGENLLKATSKLLLSPNIDYVLLGKEGRWRNNPNNHLLFYAEKVEAIQVQNLIDLLLKGKHNTVDLLIEALRDSGHKHVADLLCEERQKYSQRAVEVADAGSGVEEATQVATTSSKKMEEQNRWNA